MRARAREKNGRNNIMANILTWSQLYDIIKQKGDEPMDEIDLKRNYSVTKANQIIQKSRFGLSLAEQKTIAYICSMIKPLDSENEKGYQLAYDFNIREYCKILGIAAPCGKDYTEVKSILQGLRNKSMWVETEPDCETLMGWLSYAKVFKKNGIAKIKIDEEMAPFLFDLKEKFTSYNLINVLAMKSAYSVRLYEILKSYEFRKRIKFDISDLKKILMADLPSYENYAEFNRKVLSISMREINELTDIFVETELFRERKKVVAIEFQIKSKNTYENTLADVKRAKIIG